jgi:hypothetical protein
LAILVLLAVLAAPLTHADRPPTSRREAELAALEALLEAERGRPSGARVRDVIDEKGHRLVLFVATVGGAVERVRSFEPGFTFATLYALVLDAERRPRLILVQPQGKEEAYEIDQFLFGLDGKAAARDHTYGTSTNCADGRIHERRVVTIFGPGLRVLERRVEHFNDPPGSQLTEGCALEAATPPAPDARAFLRAHGLERAARKAGLRVEGRAAPAR